MLLQLALFKEWVSKFNYGAESFVFAVREKEICLSRFILPCSLPPQPLGEKSKRGAVHALVKKIPFVFSETDGQGRVVVMSRKKMSAQVC